MSDYEQLTPKPCKKISEEHFDDCEDEDHRRKIGDRDDLSGMALNMLKKLDGRGMAIIWIMFLFIHTETFGDHVLKRFSGARNEDGTMTMKGTIYASFFMMLVVVLCNLVF